MERECAQTVQRRCQDIMENVHISKIYLASYLNKTTNKKNYDKKIYTSVPLSPSYCNGLCECAHPFIATASQPSSQPSSHKSHQITETPPTLHVHCWYRARRKGQHKGKGEKRYRKKSSKRKLKRENPEIEVTKAPNVAS